MKIFTLSFIALLLTTTAIAQPTIIADNPRLLPLDELRILEYAWEEEMVYDAETYTLSLNKASEITHEMIDGAPYIQMLTLQELDSLPDCVKRWKDLQVFRIYSNTEDPYIPEDFANFFKYIRIMDLNIAAPNRDILHNGLLNGAYPYLEELLINYSGNYTYWDDDIEDYVTIENSLQKTKIPVEAQQWQNLKRIDFAGTEDFSDYVKTWTKLESVYLVDYEGTLGAFADCKDLYDLNLNAAQVNLEGIEALIELKSLSISGKIGTKTFPEGLNNLKNLTKLNISIGDLAYFPNDISGMDSLRDLNISLTPIEAFPNSICSLKQLESIYVYSGNIRALPEDIGRLENLRTLSLEDNRIFELPASIVELANLESIDFAYNRLGSLPQGDYQWKNAEFISFEGNQLEVLPSGFIKYLQHMSDNPEEENYSYILMGENWFSKKTKKKIDKKTNRVIDWDGMMW